MYRIHHNGIEFGVIRLVDSAWIPNCVDNADWQEYLLWVSEGGSPSPSEE